MNASEPLCENCGLTERHHRVVDTDGGPQLVCIEPPETIDESEANEAIPVSRSAAEALASWDRTLAKLEDPKFRVPKFMEAATEVLRLAKLEGNPAQRQQLIDDLFEMAVRHGVSESDVQIHMAIVSRAVEPGAVETERPEPPPVDSYEAYGGGPAAAPAMPTEKPQAAPLVTMTPEAWRGTEPQPMRWFAQDRIPGGDVTLYAGNGGSGKTETLVELLISAAAGLGDWLGCVVEPGPVLFLSCEEPEDNIRDRVERISRHRCIDPYALAEMHIHYPDLEATSLVTVDRAGVVVKSAMFESVIRFAQQRRPVLIAVDSAAAVFDGDAISRRLVRAFISMLRKLAIETGAAVVLLDHPSVRGMSDGSGTAGSVDWRNSVRSMMFLSDPDKEDPDVRTLELKKTNRGKIVEKVRLRWNGLTFSTETTGSGPSPYRAAADREVDELFLRLLDKRNAQRRPVHAKSAKGGAPSEFADDPEAGGIKAAGFRVAMERLLTVGAIVVVETGSASKRRSHLERGGK
jgi:RecA-family ATPase